MSFILFLKLKCNVEANWNHVKKYIVIICFEMIVKIHLL